MTRQPAVPAAVVRRAADSDLATITRIEHETFSRPWSLRSFEDLLRLTPALMLVAEVEGTLSGYAVGYVAADVAELANLAVRKESRGRGVGRALLDAVLAESFRRGALAVFLDVRASNLTALALYESASFAAVARRRDYYSHPVEDAIVMRRSLP